MRFGKRKPEEDVHFCPKSDRKASAHEWKRLIGDRKNVFEACKCGMIRFSPYVSDYSMNEEWFYFKPTARIRT